MDSVLADVMPAWCAVYRKNYGLEIRKEQITKWRYWEGLGLTKSEGLSLFQEAWETEDIQPTEPNIYLKLRHLKRREDDLKIRLISARPFGSLLYVLIWLKKQKILDYLDAVVFTHDSEDKVLYPYDLLVDDKPDTVMRSLMNNKAAVLYSQPWNISYKLPSIRSLDVLSPLLLEDLPTLVSTWMPIVSSDPIWQTIT